MRKIENAAPAKLKLKWIFLKTTECFVKQLRRRHDIHWWTIAKDGSQTAI